MVFLKTHKCATSTLQNMLFRYAHQNDLNVVLPLTGNYLGKEIAFDPSMIANTPWERAGLAYDVYGLHGIWNPAAVHAVMDRQAEGGKPRSRGFYFSILRDPVELFSSLWDYMNLGKHYNMSLETYALSDKTGRLRDRRFMEHVGRNQMLFDFGLHPYYFDNTAKVGEKIKQIEEDFDLVLISDRFEESVVLLKNALCWTYKDVSYLKLNARKEGKKSALSDKARKALEEWLKSDYKLYSHFSKKFEKEVARMGASKMATERQILSAANRKIRDMCVIDKAENSELPATYRNWGKGVEGYRMNETAGPLCKYYGISARAFRNELRAKQSVRAAAKMAAEGKEIGQATMFDPTKFQPLRSFTKNGLPDIESLKRNFVH